MKDILDEATSALREEGKLEQARRSALRLRVLSPRKKPGSVRWVLAFAAVLAATTAWAGVTHHWWGIGSGRAAASPPVPSVTLVARGDVTSELAPVVEVAAPLVSKPTQPQAERVVVSPTASVPASSSALPIETHPSTDDAERQALRAYREAERLQFTDKDYARALDAWDRYLAQAGQSPLVVDARYARAVCLVQVGRRDEARAALLPFASGAVGAYRQAEAQSLLDTLR